MTEHRAYDHLVLDVHDLEQARATYQKLGFTLTPVAIHPFGTHNSLVQMQGEFLELLSVNNPALIGEHEPGKFSFGAFNRDYLKSSEGLAQVVFYGADAPADAKEFAAKGLSNYAPFDFSRLAKLPDGSEVTVSFSLAFVTHDEMKYASFFSCHQHSPQYFWKEQYQSHANGARHLVETMMVAKDPQSYLSFFEALLNSTGTVNKDGILQFAMSNGKYSVFSPEQWEHRFAGEKSPDLQDGPRMAGYHIAVSSLGDAVKCLNDNGMGFTETGDGIFVSSDIAHGSLIYFTEQS